MMNQNKDLRIVVTGSDGQLGQHICGQVQEQAIGLGRRKLDITCRESIKKMFDAYKPSVVVNCAAYTAVDLAETESTQCRLVNVMGPELLAEYATAANCKLVHVSSDYVFHDRRVPERPWLETDAASPTGVYAKSKFDGEQAVLNHKQHLVIRTCGLYSSHGSNFVKTMLRLSLERQLLKVVDDQECTPSYCVDVARAILYLADSGESGLFHVVNNGSTTWFDFAKEIFRLANRSTSVEPISTEVFGAAAPRPAYSVLDTTRYLKAGGPRLRSWREGLRDFLLDNNSAV